MAKTFSLMSNPDILLTIQAYTRLKIHKEKALEEITTREDSGIDQDLLQRSIVRLDELSDELSKEWELRKNG